MTELDFDELDKAVSDLMKDASGTPAVESSPKATAVNIGVVDKKPEEAVSSPVNPEASPSQSLAVKRRGRFMDVMPSNTPQAAASLQKHTAIAVNTPGEDSANKPSADSDSQEPAEGIVMADVPQDDTKESSGYAADPEPLREWPDPIDVAEERESTHENEPHEQDPAHGEAEMEPPTGAPKDDVASEPALVDAPQAEDSIDTVFHPEVSDSDDTNDTNTDESSEGSVDDEPAQQEHAMESPFIPDAKVDKRPLGGFTLEQPQESTEGAREESGVGDDQKSSEPSIPRELSSELMNLETDGNDVPSDKPIEGQQAPADETVVPAVSAPAPEIKQQYTPVAHESNTHSTGAIYDTSEYHQPLPAAPKKKHTWLLYLIWIMSALIIGACVGAAYFYFTTR